MSKFIEVTDEGQQKYIVNTAHIVEVRMWGIQNLAELLIKDRRYELRCLESFEEVKAMLMYDPAVADIILKGKELS